MQGAASFAVGYVAVPAGGRYALGSAGREAKAHQLRVRTKSDPEQTSALAEEQHEIEGLTLAYTVLKSSFTLFSASPAVDDQMTITCFAFATYFETVLSRPSRCCAELLQDCWIIEKF